MRQADSSNSTTAPARAPEPTRRAALALATATALAATGLGAVAAHGMPDGAPDPIYAAIARHKEAMARLHDVLRAIDRVESELPPFSFTRWQWHDDEPAPPADHDIPQAWIDVQFRLRDAAAADDAASLALLDAAPTSLAGLAALVRYVVTTYDAGFTMPDIVDDDNPVSINVSDGFLFLLHRHVAASLERLAPAA